MPWCANRSHWSFSDRSGGWQGIPEGSNTHRLRALWHILNITISFSLFWKRQCPKSQCLSDALGREPENTYPLCSAAPHSTFRNSDVFGARVTTPEQTRVARTCWCVCAQLLSRAWVFCDSLGCSPPGSSVHGISQARVLEWVPSPLQGIFLIQVSNLGLLSILHRQVDFLPLAPPGKPLYLLASN